MIERRDGTSTTDLSSIQVLRAFAAIAVVLFHVIKTGKINHYDSPLLAFLDGWGACGVDLFFVISGYIMMVMQKRRHDTPRSFMANRIARIVPLYWSLTALFAVIGVVVPSALKSHAITGEWTVLSFLFLSQAVIGEQPILFLGWTLELEMLFYLLFAASLFVPRRRFAPAIAATAIVGAALLLDLSILIEFVFGMAIGLMSGSGRTPRRIAVACVVSGGLGLCAWPFLPEAARIDRLFVWGIPAALIVFGAIGLRQWHWKLARTLGDASYSIYLVQVFTIPVFLRLLSPIQATHEWPIASAFACIGFTAIVGWMIHRVYDVHVHALAKSILSPAPAAKDA